MLVHKQFWVPLTSIVLFSFLSIQWKLTGIKLFGYQRSSKYLLVCLQQHEQDIIFTLFLFLFFIYFQFQEKQHWKSSRSSVLQKKESQMGD